MNIKWWQAEPSHSHDWSLTTLQCIYLITTFYSTLCATVSILDPVPKHFLYFISLSERLNYSQSTSAYSHDHLVLPRSSLICLGTHFWGLCHLTLPPGCQAARSPHQLGKGIFLSKPQHLGSQRHLARERGGILEMGHRNIRVSILFTLLFFETSNKSFREKYPIV